MSAAMESKDRLTGEWGWKGGWKGVEGGRQARVASGLGEGEAGRVGWGRGGGWGGHYNTIR
jgi:hypothetical protein